MKQVILSKSARETASIGKSLARSLPRGTTVALLGNLGAGKTVFAKGFAAGLGIKESVTSPTFILMNVYQVRRKDIQTFVHVDCYRVARTSDMKDIGLEEYTRDPKAVVLIEWADRVKKILPRGTVTVSLRVAGETSRRIVIDRPRGVR